MCSHIIETCPAEGTREHAATILRSLASPADSAESVQQQQHQQLKSGTLKSLKSFTMTRSWRSAVKLGSFLCKHAFSCSHQGQNHTLPGEAAAVPVPSLSTMLGHCLGLQVLCPLQSSQSPQYRLVHSTLWSWICCLSPFRNDQLLLLMSGFAEPQVYPTDGSTDEPDYVNLDTMIRVRPCVCGFV